MPNLLFEVQTEELPTSYIEPALKTMKAMLKELLQQHGLFYRDLGAEGTPRRLVLFAEDVPEQTPPRVQEIQGPPAKVAFTNGRPTSAAVGFAKKFGLKPEELLIKETESGTYCFVRVETPGRPAITVLSDGLVSILRAVRFPKSMVWEAGGVRFARPIRRMMALFGATVLPVSFAGLVATNRTTGHRFTSPQELEVPGADLRAFIVLLEKHGVVLEYNRRRETIHAQLKKIAAKHGAQPAREELVDEVANMVECPTVGEGAFPAEYLELPSVVVEEAMVEHQRYFPFYKDGRLLNIFAFVADRPEESLEVVRGGNERVLKARLEDARFYFVRDRSRPLEDFAGDLQGVLFHEKLGTYAEKVERLVGLCSALAEHVGLPRQQREHLLTAARLCKADLATSIVAEMPGLQGRIGAEYARLDNLPEEVAVAIAEHYLPARADGPLPGSICGALLSIAEKADNIVGFWAAGEKPSGARDPFAIRRQTVGIVRILDRFELDLEVRRIFGLAAELLPQEISPKDVVEEVVAFFRERLRAHLLDSGWRGDFVAAVLATGITSLPAIKARLEALKRLSQEPIWGRLCETVQRTKRIARITKDKVPREVRAELLREPQERLLYERLVDVQPRFSTLVEERRFYEAAHLYHQAFADAVHHFFDKVFVNVEEKEIRDNRIALCLAVHRLFGETVADLSLIEAESYGGRKSR